MFWWLLTCMSWTWGALPAGTTPLPVVHIETGNQVMSEMGIVAGFGIADKPTGNGFSDPCNVHDGRADINWHGSSSIAFPKKSYAIELLDAAGGEAKVSLLGMSSESGWILSAGYTDKSMIRNAFGYAMAAATGRYAPRTRMVELVVDGGYEGVYLLAERPMRDKERIAVSKLESTDSAGDAVTGGYVLRVDRASDGNGWVGSRGGKVYYQHYYPKDSKITDGQRAYIRQWMASFETALAAGSISDPQSGYPKWIDVGSFQDYLLVQELSRNADGYRLSAFLSKDRDSKGGKLQAGPIWDLDITMGLADYYDGWTTSGWVYEWDAKAANDPYPIPSWWPRLARDPVFRTGLACRWKVLRTGAWSDISWRKTFDSLARLAGAVQARNYKRWDMLKTKVWPEVYVPGTFQAEIDTLRSWLSGRIAWMDKQFLSSESSCPVPIAVVPRDARGQDGFSMRGDELRWNVEVVRAMLVGPDGSVRALDMTRTVTPLAGSARGAWIVAWREREDGIWRSRSIVR